HLRARAASLRVALVAATVRGAGGDYVKTTAEAMAPLADVSVWIPSWPPLELSADVVTVRHEKQRGKGAIFVDELMAFARRPPFEADLEAWKPDVVHVLFGEGYPSSLRLCRQLAKVGVTTAVTMHDPEPH